MIFINLLIILLYVMLAVLSRMHYSKYKGSNGVKGVIKRIFYAMSNTIYIHVRRHINMDGIKNNLRRLKVVSGNKLEGIAEEFVIRLMAASLGVFFVFNVAAMVYEGIFVRHTSSDEEYYIEREGYQGGVKYRNIYMEVDDDTYVYRMAVAPLEYTEEEFCLQAESIFAQLEKEMLYENEDAEHIRSDLKLPICDEQGIFRIRWMTDNPEYLTAAGRVTIENIDRDIPVVLTATIEYLEYSVSRDYMLVIAATVDNPKIDIVRQRLDDLEAANRSSRTFMLPSEISGVDISVTQKDDNISFRILVLGGVISVAIAILMLSRLKGNAEIECNMLNDRYAFFVNRLWLLLGTGMTIKSCFKHIISESGGEDILIRELMYTMNQIDSGFDEAKAYEQLGERIGIQKYTRLLKHVSQNLSLGTRNLRKLMEEDVYMCFEERKENARRKGEEASTKLVFPMILLLATVMVILMFPAFVGF